MVTKADRAQQKQEEILDAATAAFRDEGYETASMDRIAELASASKRTVYNHFGSKEALFQAVVGRLVDRAEGAKRIGWDPGRGVEEQLADFARAKAMFSESPAELDLMRVVLGVFIRHPELAQETMARANESEAYFVRWLEAARDAGQLQVEDIHLASKLFWGLVSGTLFWPALVEGPMRAEERERTIREIVSTFLARYAAGQ